MAGANLLSRARDEVFLAALRAYIREQVREVVREEVTGVVRSELARIGITLTAGNLNIKGGGPFEDG